MSFAAWFQSARFHFLAPPHHWADVMAQVDLLTQEHGEDALAVAEQRAATFRCRQRRLFSDVATELRRRALAQPAE